MLREQFIEVLGKSWPMLIVFTVIISSIRFAYLKVNRQKFVFYKEASLLLFMIYILLLFYVVTYQDPVSTSISSYNLVPFKEILRYDIGSVKFYKNIVGNLLIFVPFGFFVSCYLKKKKFGVIFLLSLISSLTIEFTQRLIGGRVFDIDDIILNVTGGMIGYFIYVIFDEIIDHVPRVFKKDWFVNLLIIALIIFIYLYVYNFEIKLPAVASWMI